MMCFISICFSGVSLGTEQLLLKMNETKTDLVKGNESYFIFQHKREIFNTECIVQELSNFYLT